MHRDLAIGLLAAATAAILVAGVAVGVERSVQQSTAAPNSTGSPAAHAASPPRPDAGPAASATETLDEQLHRVARTVARVRELRFVRLPRPTYVTADELAARARGLLRDYSAGEADEDQRILIALGALPAGTDLRRLLADALSQQLAGFYDPKTGELVVGADQAGGSLSPLNEITLAHELQHVLADQSLGLPAHEDVPHGAEDAALAAHALVEGDATLTMVVYAREALSTVDRVRLLEEQSALAAELARLAPLPHFVQRSLSFPYEEGLAFVAHLKGHGGWNAVNAAYRRLPATSLQILRPDLYLRGRGGGQPVRDIPAPGRPWQRQARLALGAADLLFLFEAPGGDTSRALDDPPAAADGWRGGQVTLYTAGDRTGVGLRMVGEQALCGAVTAWYAATLPQAAVSGAPRSAAGRRFHADTQDAVVRCAGREVRVGIAPDLATARRLAA